MNDLTKMNELLLDRVELKEKVELDLLRFIKLQIDKVNNETSLKTEVLDKLKDRLNDNEDPMNDVVLLKLLEILAKQDNEIALGIMDLMKSNKESKQTDNPIQPNEEIKQSDLTKNDVSEIKDILKTLDRIKKSEFV